jgi:hypothetical protein
MGLTRITDTQMLSFFFLDRRRRPFVAMIDAQQAVPEVRLSERIARQILVSTKRGIEPLPHRNHQSLLTVSTASVAATDRVYQFHNCKGRGQNMCHPPLEENDPDEEKCGDCFAQHFLQVEVGPYRHSAPHGQGRTPPSRRQRCFSVPRSDFQ